VPHVIDLINETRLNLEQAAALFTPYRDGVPTHKSRVLRAIQQGAKDPEGNVVKLEAVRFGGQWVTSVEAIQRYAERLTPSAAPAPAPAAAAPRRSPAKRRRDHQRAEKQLDERRA
jgi:hypothetical protein